MKNKASHPLVVSWALTYRRIACGLSNAKQAQKNKKRLAAGGLKTATAGMAKYGSNHMNNAVADNPCDARM